MKRTLLVTYDICDPARLRRVYTIMRGWGTHLQLSVFLCDLSRRQELTMQAQLEVELHHAEDQVLIVDLGPSSGRGQRAIRALGRPYEAPESGAQVL